MFSAIDGDGLLDLFANVDTEKAGDPYAVWLFSRFAACSFIALVTVIAFNLLIALFNSSYEKVRVCQVKEFYFINGTKLHGLVVDALNVSL